MKWLMRLGFAVMAATLCGVGVANAWHLTGRVFCDANGLPLASVQIVVVSTDPGVPFTGTGTTDETGAYTITLLDFPESYHVVANVSQNETIVTPASGFYDFTTDASDFDIARDWVIASPACAQEACWLTGGGTKFSSVTGTLLGTSVKQDNFGGNVNPGCSPTAGDGGNWNDIDAQLKLHFHGTAIQVVRCGNVDGIPPGSTSPVTPFNFIEFQGTGTLKGIQGNKADYGTIYFFGRAEDRNEPGSNGAKAGSLIDRYFLNVFSNPSDPVGSSLMLVDGDGDPATVDPVMITDGNLQIHVSSCDTPPISTDLAPKGGRASSRPALTGEGASTVPGELWLAAATPNPTRTQAGVRLGLPRDANVALGVYDVTGRLVRELASGWLSAGVHSLVWDLRSARGESVPAGVYFLRLGVEGQVVSRNVAVVR